MYSIECSDDVIEQLSALTPKSEPGVRKHLEGLVQNPLARAKPTNNPALGDYYIHAGNKYDILFNINEDKKTIAS